MGADGMWDQGIVRSGSAISDASFADPLELTGIVIPIDLPAPDGARGIVIPID